MKPEASATSWLKFFTAAGISTKEAEHYAVTFSMNQIQFDMLPEINKEYLNDMGITLLGHIIAILRHAKTVYADEMKKSELSTTKKQPVGSSKEKPIIKTNKAPSPNKPLPNLVEKPAPSSSKRKSSVVPLPSADSSEPKPKVKKTLCDSSDDINVPIIKTASNPRVTIPDVLPADEGRKGVFKRLGSEVSQISVETENSPSNGNGESVFARLGGKSNFPQVTKVAALGQTKRVLIAKEEAPTEVIPRKSIIRTRLDKPRDKPRVTSTAYMDTIAGIVSPSYMDRIIEERKQSSKLISSTSGLLMEKKDIKARLGLPSSKMVNSKGTGPGKKVSFGSVQQKIIPRVNKPPTFKSNLNTGPKISIGASPLSPKRFSIGCSSSLRSLSVGSSSGVFSRLGT